MITLGTGKTLQGVASLATTISYSLFGLLKTVSTGADLFDLIAQGQLPAAAGVLYTVPADTNAVFRVMLSNTSSSAVTGIRLYANGTAASNQLAGPITLPGYGFAIIDRDGWKTYDQYGRLLTAVTYGSGGGMGYNVKDYGATGDGSTDDTTAWVSLTSAAQVANQRGGFDGLLVVRSLTTVQCECLGFAQAALLPTVVAAVGTTTIATTADWYITISCTCSVGTFTAQEAVVAMM
jgi:hypothetical protein